MEQGNDGGNPQIFGSSSLFQVCSYSCVSLFLLLPYESFFFLANCPIRGSETGDLSHVE